MFPQSPTVAGSLPEAPLFFLPGSTALGYQLRVVSMNLHYGVGLM